jgi:regulatory protein
MIIAKLEPSKHVQERWLVWLEDGSLIRVTENEVVTFALYEGMEISDGLYDQLVEKAGRSEARGKALDLIAAKPMSRRTAS